MRILNMADEESHLNASYLFPNGTLKQCLAFKWGSQVKKEFYFVIIFNYVIIHIILAK